MPSVLLLLLLVFAFFIVLATLKGKQDASGSVGFPYQPAKALFSAAERSFLGVLEQAVGPEHKVFGKVRVADIALVKTGLGNSARQGALNRIAAKHFDFIVCRASDLSIVCAVELNDKSHANQRAQMRDEFLAKVCQTIHLPLITIPAKQTYSLPEVQAQFVAAVSPPLTAPIRT